MLPLVAIAPGEDGIWNILVAENQLQECGLVVFFVDCFRGHLYYSGACGPRQNHHVRCHIKTVSHVLFGAHRVGRASFRRIISQVTFKYNAFYVDQETLMETSEDYSIHASTWQCAGLVHCARIVNQATLNVKSSRIISCPQELRVRTSWWLLAWSSGRWLLQKVIRLQIMIIQVTVKRNAIYAGEKCWRNHPETTQFHAVTSHWHGRQRVLD
jgi:hypothetical protein